jgi:hypothetical protein
MSDSAVGCKGFYATDRNAQERGAKRYNDKPLPCETTIRENTVGWCACSDSMPRFVDLGHQPTTCRDVCQTSPDYYTSKTIPPLRGEPRDAKRIRSKTLRYLKLSAAMGAFIIGCILLVFHFIHDEHENFGGRRAFVDLVKATGIQPSVPRAHPSAPTLLHPTPLPPSHASPLSHHSPPPHASPLSHLSAMAPSPSYPRP